ncbi:F-box/TPR repeat protein pof3 [Elsinoe australis]|uniref:F-box/TPR repeat protein pof3 n=1 Tax=Elsinoe australis TaxID=40998 RepID=A0A2P7ZZU8_9PEZI|nr:F-box/TPR repeat protein pof3 [Elsinoe australis]
MPHRLSSTELEEIARSSYKNGNFGSALVTIDQAINTGSTAVASQLDLRAAVKEKLGDFESALQDAKALIRKHYQDPRGYLRAAKILHHMKKPNNAVLIFERGLKMVPETTAGYSVMAEKHKKLLQLLLPNTKCDPFTYLPLEIVEMVLSHLAFRQRTMCTSVSKSWRRLLHTLPGLWTDLDLSRAIKPVQLSFITTCINRSHHRIHAATLFRIAKFDPVISALTSRCNHLTSLSIRHSSPSIPILTASLSQATRLTTLSLSGFSLEQSSLRAMLAALPSLLSLTADELLGERRLAHWTQIPASLLSLTLRAAPKQGIPYIYLAGILAHAPSLHTLVLSGWGQVHGSPELDFVRQKELQTLHVDAGVLTLLNLPETIVELSVNCYLGAPPRPMGAQKLHLPLLERLTCRTMQDVEVLLSDGGEEVGRKLTHLAIPAAELAVDWKTSTLMSDRLRDVKELKLFGARHVDDDLVPVILLKMKDLEVIDLSHSDVTGVGIKGLVVGCKRLKKLGVACCNDLGMDAVEWARTKGIEVDCFWEKSGAQGGRVVRYGF